MSVFRSAEWVLDRLGLAAQRELRRLLRGCEHALDARLAAIYVTGPAAATGVLVEYHGDDSAMPQPFPIIASSVPSYESVRCTDGDEHTAVVQRIRIGRGLPALGMVVVGAGATGPGVLDLVEESADRVEDAIVRAITRPDRSRART